MWHFKLRTGTYWETVFFPGETYEKRNGMKEPDHFGETVSTALSRNTPNFAQFYHHLDPIYL